MQSMTSSGMPLFPILIVVVLMAVGLAVATVRATGGQGGPRDGGGGKFPRHRASQPLLALLAAGVAAFTGLLVFFMRSRPAERMAAAAMDVTAASPADSVPWLWVSLIIGALALVAALVAVLRMRDGGH
jgi:hypothetical protein